MFLGPPESFKNIQSKELFGDFFSSGGCHNDSEMMFGSFIF